MLRLVLVACALWCSTIAARAQQHPSLPDSTVPNGLGINIHFTQPMPGEMEMLAATGVKWVRMDWGWGRTERAKGAYDWAEPDKLVAALEKHKLRAVFVLSYGNKLYSPVSPATDESRAAFARWAVAAVTHFKGRGIVWEMWNEPNIGFWRPAPNAQDYIKLARLTGEAIKKAAPGEAFIGPTLARFDWPFFEACFKGGLLQFFDAVSVHPYRNTSPDTAKEDYARLRALIAQYAPRGKSIPVLSGEWGYSSGADALTEEQQARYLARQWLTNLSQGVPLSVWYDWRDDGDNPQEREHRYGMVRRPHLPGARVAFHPKPAYFAAQTLIRALKGYRFERRLETGSPQDWVLLFRRAGSNDFKIAAWTSLKEGRTVSLPLDGRFQVAELMGKMRPAVVAENGKLALELSPAVIYATPKDSD